MSEICGYCRVELCFLCEEPKEESEKCCCLGTYGRVTLGALLSDSTIPRHTVSRESRDSIPTDDDFGLNQDGSIKKSRAGRPIIDDGADMRNPVSAGRRRANKIAKIPPGYVCEWALLEFAGGGVVPIVGCAGNTASDLHHGPDKSTLNNEVGINLHRICDTCHNRWHELNDGFYGDRPADNMNYLPTDREVEPHDRITRADTGTVFASDKWWGQPKSDRVEYRQWKLRTHTA
jgi:hypothetical protein